MLALHHAPIATPVALMDVLELRGQDQLAEVLRGRDVRLILGGHLHYPTNGSFAGIPVAVAGATSYTIDVSAAPPELVGVDGGRSFNLVHLFDDGVVTSVVPVGPFATVSNSTTASSPRSRRSRPTARSSGSRASPQSEP